MDNSAYLSDCNVSCDNMATDITLYMMNIQVFISLQYIYLPLDVPNLTHWAFEISDFIYNLAATIHNVLSPNSEI